MKSLVILGAGTAGTTVANRLFSLLDADQWRITIVDQNETHYYQPGFLFIPFGIYSKNDVVKPKRDFIPAGVELIMSPIEQIDAEHNRVTLSKDKRILAYDFLVIATGCQIHPEQTPGLKDGAWGQTIHEFYTVDGAVALAKHLRTWRGGRLVVNVVDNPIKCPVAPLEFACLVDDYLTQRGLRSKTELTLVTPLTGAFTKPICNEVLTDMLVEKGVKVIPNASLAAVTDNTIVCPDGKAVPYDLLVTIPPHEGSDLIDDAGLGDGIGFGLTDKQTLKSIRAERVFLVGDNTNVPTSKAGSVAHFQAEVVVHNLLREIDGKPALPLADGHANCFIETGYGKAILIDFNYDIQPVPGNFPLPIVGPMSLLKETRLNHLGKLAFRPIYWNMLLPGRHIPLVGSRMSTTGKQMAVLDRKH